MFLGGVFKIFLYINHVICKERQFYFFFSNSMPFIYVSYLITLARTPVLC